MFGASRPVRATRQSLSDGSYASSFGQYDPLKRSSVRNYGQNLLNNSVLSGQIPRSRNAEYMANNPRAAGFAQMANTGVMPSLVLSDEAMKLREAMAPGLKPYGSLNIRELTNTLNPLASNYSNNSFNPATSASGVNLQARKPPLENYGKLKDGINYMTTGFNQGYAGTQSMNQEIKNNPFGTLLSEQQNKRINNL